MVRFDRIAIMNDFTEIIRTIENADIQKFVNDVLEDASSEFWHAVSSVSLKNHPPEDNIEDIGLLIHTIKAFAVAETLFRFFGVVDITDQDIVRAALILHDICKQGNPWGIETDREHGRICADFIEKYELNDYIKKRIQSCIRTHMSRWAYPMDSFKEFIFPDKLQTIVALSDYIASRNEISFYPNIPVCDVDQINIKVPGEPDAETDI